MPLTVGVVIGATISTKVSPRVGPRLPVAAGPALTAVGLFILTFLTVRSDYLAHVFPAVVLIGIGFGIAMGPLTSTALVGVADRDAGVASALVTCAFQIGGSIGLALLNTIAVQATRTYAITRHFGPGHTRGQAAATVHGATVGYWLAAAFMVVATAIAAGVIRVRGKAALLAEPADVVLDRDRAPSLAREQE